MADMVDAREPGSPGWHLDRLGRKLMNDRPRLEMLDAYYRGNPRLPESHGSASAYQRFQRKARTTFGELVVEAPRQRMNVVGFRTGADGDENGDKEARRIWDVNDLDVSSADLHRNMLALGKAYAIVGMDDETGDPVITEEDPRQVTTQQDPRIQRRTLAGLKLYTDQLAEEDHAYLYLPGEVWHAMKRSDKLGGAVSMDFRVNAWEWVSAETLPIPVVPVVRFRNARGMGEFEAHLDHLDRINSMLLQRLVIAVMQAFRQRAVQGDLPRVDDQGATIDYNAVFEAGPDALWQLPPDVTIWESAQVDLTPILSAIRDDVQHLAAVTQTPMHYFNAESTNGSAEGAALVREGLVFKTEDRINRANIGWRAVMSLAFAFQKDEKRAALSALAPIWASPERRTLAERADAASKATDIPWRTKMTELWQFPPELVDRMESERAADAFLAAALGAVVTGQPAVGGPQGRQGRQPGADRQPAAAGQPATA